MDYIDVATARNLDGLRLVLTAGVPGPWGESAKSLFELKKIPYVAVRQQAGGENAELQDWTGQSSAPVAIYRQEPPRSDSLQILHLAERLKPQPGLIPGDIAQRVQMFGLLRELIGERGFAWYRRILMIAPVMDIPALSELAQRLGGKYGYSEAELAVAEQRCIESLKFFAAQLRAQYAQGRHFFIGEQLTAMDVYWAHFSNMVSPLPHELNPMPEATRTTYDNVPDAIRAAVDPILITHRDDIYQRYLTLPLDF